MPLTLSAGPRVLNRVGPGRRPGNYRLFDLRAQAPTIGAEIDGLDLRRPVTPELFAELDAALREWKVLVFRRQDLSPEEHLALAGLWGQPTDDQLLPTPQRNPVDNLVVFSRDETTPGLENEWHTDGTFRLCPTVATVLRAIETPEVGGDTLFADMAAAYDNLPVDLQSRAAQQTATHDWSLGEYATKYRDRLDEFRAALPPVEHPVVIAHPATGRPTLFVNRLFTECINGVPADESAALVDAYAGMAGVPEWQYRLHWQPGTVAIWDNLAVQHYGVNDYFPGRRVMARATILGTVRPQSCRTVATAVVG